MYTSDFNYFVISEQFDLLQSLLGIDPELAEQYQKLLMEDRRLDREHLRRHNEYSEKELLR